MFCHNLVSKLLLAENCLHQDIKEIKDEEGREVERDKKQNHLFSLGYSLLHVVWYCHIFGVVTIRLGYGLDDWIY
jgi:hypothetical protein